MMPTFRMAVLAAVALGGYPGFAAAQSNCGDIVTTYCLMYEHRVPMQDPFNATAPHGDCRQCFPLSSCHQGCAEAMLLDTARMKMYARALEAAVRGNAGALLAMAAGLTDHIRVNQQRSTVQLYSCAQTNVIASLSIPSAIAQRYAMDQFSMRGNQEAEARDDKVTVGVIR